MGKTTNILDLNNRLTKVEKGNVAQNNSLYRGKSLGTVVTQDQWDDISAGTFDDMYIGDYWTINSRVYRIAAFDYWLHTGDAECIKHHVVVVPDASLYDAKMNDSDITTGGYIGSKMYTDNLAAAKTTIKGDFGAAHILTHRQLLTNAVTKGASSSWAWYDSQIDLMNESMVYGHEAWSSAPGYDTGIDKSQLALFQARPDLITNRENWWLRDVVSAAAFALVLYDGSAGNVSTSYSFGVRPAFGIC